MNIREINVTTGCQFYSQISLARRVPFPFPFPRVGSRFNTQVEWTVEGRGFRVGWKNGVRPVDVEGPADVGLSQPRKKDFPWVQQNYNVGIPLEPQLILYGGQAPIFTMKNYFKLDWSQIL
jgi:hypothetical protein